MFDQQFGKKVRKFLVKSDWSVSESMLANFVAERDRIHMLILLGPDLFERGFKPVNAIYTEKLTMIKKTIKTPNVVVVVRDRDTLPYYSQVDTGPVSLLLFENIEWLDRVRVSRLASAPADDDASRWAEALVMANPQLCRRTAQQAAISGNAQRALFWAGKAVAADRLDPLNHAEVAGANLLLGNIESANDAILIAIELLPDSAPLLSRASVIAFRRGQDDDALAFAKRAVEAEDKRPIDHHHLARLYLKHAEISLADRQAKQAIALDPDNVQFQNTLNETAKLLKLG